MYTQSQLKAHQPSFFFKYCHNMSNAIYEVCVCTYCAAAYITDAIFPLFLLGVNFLIFDTEQSGVLSLSRESSIPTRAQSFDWIHPFLSLSTLEKICSDQEYVHI